MDLTKPDAQLAAYWACWFEGVPDTYLVNFAAFKPDGKGRADPQGTRWVPVGSLANPDNIKFLYRQAAKCDVYMGVALAAAPAQSKRGGKDRYKQDEITCLPGVWVDIDLYTAMKPNPALPATMADALDLIRMMGPDPTMIVNSGHGVHAYWRFREPWMIDTPAARDAAKALTKGWVYTLVGHAKSRGQIADANVWNLDRILRPPGLSNRKDPANIQDTVLIDCAPDRAYDPDDLRTYLRVPDDTPQDSGSGPPKPDCQFTMNPAAMAPMEKWAVLCTIHPAALLTWKHLNPALNNQDDSAVEMSLASQVMVHAPPLDRWTDQDVVDLLIHHRREKCGEGPKHRGYYEKTLATAYQSHGAEEARKFCEDVASGKDLPPNLDKEQAINFLAAKLGLTGLTAVLAVDTEPTQYSLAFGDRTVPMGDNGFMLNALTYKKRWIDRTQQSIPPLKKGEWNAIERAFITAITVASVGPEGTKQGQVELTVLDHLADVGIRDEEDNWQDAALAKDPFRLDGYVYFSGQRIITIMRDIQGTDLKVPDIRRCIRHMKAENGHKRVKNTAVRVWKIREPDLSAIRRKFFPDNDHSGS